ncbi:hypothetical protein M1M11_08105 [Pseudomonas azerbaijanoccidens]|uniref:hypothetical protein n=1 Tax=Pseudomonas azerbaijanoccidentalis TaxID=2842347 RepID=UPI00200A34FC|nr:hypothetical protein [Pseudomonas azerbaijanoccidentalis]MCK8664846.1 hypothetical protein [Pseudomonas azerbaijanoccidentalis]
MNVNETRQKLITLIAEHQFANPGKKLQIGSLSAQAGISRQAFNRYYKDLKPYAQGLKPIGELLAGADQAETSELLNQSHTTLLDLTKQLSLQKRQFELEKEEILNSHITTLMNDDLTLFSANEIQQTLARQTLHNENLLKEISNLKLELIKTQQKSLVAQPSRSASSSSKIIIDTDLSEIFSEYHKNGDYDAFEDRKEQMLEVVLTKVNKLCRTSNSDVVIFTERYISSFQAFADKYVAKTDTQQIIIRLPIYTRAELKAFIGKLSSPATVKIYTPYCESQGVIKAQRAFHFRSVPDFEAKAADQAHTVTMDPAIEEVCTFKIRQGD